MSRLMARLLLASAASAAFVPALQPDGAVRHRSGCTLRMVAAKDVYDSYCEQAPPLQRSLQSMTPTVAGSALNGVVAAAAAVGYVAMPSSKIAVNAVGGALTGSIGVVARKRLAAKRRESAITAAAAVLSRGLNTVSPEDLASIAESHDVPRAQFQKQLASLFLVFLNSCLTASTIETPELSELHKLVQLLRLSPAQVGMQVYAAGRSLYSRHRAYLEDEEDSDSKRLLTKFVFLAERLISSDESEEGYRYEAMRCQRLFSLKESEWKERAESAAVPFYDKTLSSAVLGGKPVTAAQLTAVRDSLGITAGRAEALHEDVYGKCVAELLAPAEALSEADEARLSTVESLLGLAPEVAAGRQLALTAPLYKAAVSDILAEVEATGASPTLSGNLALRQKQLLVSSAAARDVERDATRERAQALLVEAGRYQRTQNSAKAVEAVQATMGYCSAVGGFLAEAAGGGEALAPYAGLSDGVLKEMEKLGLYRLMLVSCLDDLKVDEAEEALLAPLASLLSLSDEARTSVYEAAAGPLYRKALEKALASDMGAEQKAELQQSVADLALPAPVTAAIAAEVYGAKLREVAGDAKIMNEEQAESLTVLREFLGLDISDVYDAHADVCSGAYKSSVTEVMGAAGGVIPDEYFEGLETLRTRLGLSPETSQSIFAQVARGKMVSFGQKAVEALEEKAKAQNKPADEEASGELGMKQDPLTAEILNLVEFCEGSKVLTKEGDAETTIVDLRSDFEPKMLVELYRQYLIEAFSGKSQEQNQRLFSNLERLSLVLGLQAPEVSSVHNELGKTIFENYLSKALQKGPVGDQERQFLYSVKETLSLDQDKCDELVREQEITRVSNLMESLFGGAAITAEGTRKMRDTAEQLDVSLTADVGVLRGRLDKMFVVEVEDLIDAGTLTPEDTGDLEEICEAFEVNEERATMLLEETAAKRIKAGLLQASALYRQGATEPMVTEVTRLLKFATFSPSQAPIIGFSADDKQELYMLYEASLLADADADAGESASQLEVLKKVIGLSAPAVA